MNNDPIVDAKSVTALMAALVEVYGWNLPLSFPPSTPLEDLWAIPITVRQDPEPGVLYDAIATATFPVAPILSGTVIAQVRGSVESVVPLPAASSFSPPKVINDAQNTNRRGRPRRASR
jgi:hypothetical protein